MKIKSLINQSMICTALLVFSSSSLCNSPDITLGLGYDDNAYRFYDEFNPPGGAFQRLNLSWTHKFKWGTSFYVYGAKKMFSNTSDETEVALPTKDNPDNTRRYDRNLSGGDTFSGKIRLRQSNQLNLFNRYTKLNLDLTYGERDKTYLSRVSGHSLYGFSSSKPEEFPGLDISNRYDYDFNEGRIKLSIKPSKKMLADFYFDRHDRNFYDYSQIVKNYRQTSSISNLDFVEDSLGTNWQYRFNRYKKLTFYFESATRNFDDKRTRTLEGKSINPSDLSYDIIRLRSKFESRINKKWSAEFDARYETREDNTTGYYNMTAHRETATAIYKISKQSNIEFEISYSSLDYPKRNTDGLSDEEEYSAADGLIYRVNYEKLVHKDSKIRFYTNFSYYDFDSNKANYAFSRTILESGLKLPLFH